MPRIVSWNINGIRSHERRLRSKGGFRSILDELECDIFCAQETKTDLSTLDAAEAEALAVIQNYDAFFSASQKRRGWSGVATYVRRGVFDVHAARESFGGAEPADGEERYDNEGRIVCTDHGGFVMFNLYVPNGGSGEERHAYKMRFYAALLERCRELMAAGRDVVVLGDINTAHRDIDIWNPSKFEGKSGFCEEDRKWLDDMLALGFVDTFRHVHGDVTRKYTFWDNYTQARQTNDGWRIDYILITPGLVPLVTDATIHSAVKGSDHCPISLTLSAVPQAHNDAPTPPAAPDKLPLCAVHVPSIAKRLHNRRTQRSVADMFRSTPKAKAKPAAPARASSAPSPAAVAAAAAAPPRAAVVRKSASASPGKPKRSALDVLMASAQRTTPGGKKQKTKK